MFIKNFTFSMKYEIIDYNILSFKNKKMHMKNIGKNNL